MDGTARQQAYDRGHTIFSPDGRLYQVEYARKAVERGSPAVGVRTDDGVVLAARKRIASPLQDPETVTKIHRIDDHLAVASAGHAADARRLVEHARLVGQRHRLRYDEPAPVESVTTAVADHVQESTQTGGSRPFGTALLVAGVDPSRGGGLDESFELYEVDPSGTPYGWQAVAIGDGAAGIRETFEETFQATLDDRDSSELSVEEAAAIALDGLAAEVDDPDPVEYDCTTIQSGPEITTSSRADIDRLFDRAAS